MNNLVLDPLLTMLMPVEAPDAPRLLEFRNELMVARRGNQDEQVAPAPIAGEEVVYVTDQGDWRRSHFEKLREWISDDGHCPGPGASYRGLRTLFDLMAAADGGWVTKAEAEQRARCSGTLSAPTCPTRTSPPFSARLRHCRADPVRCSPGGGSRLGPGPRGNGACTTGAHAPTQLTRRQANMTRTAAHRGPDPRAVALAETTSTWNTWFDGARRPGNDDGIWGPYLVFAASRGTASNLAAFAGTPIPHLDQDAGQVTLSTWSLYALPACVYDRCSRSTRRGDVVSTLWGLDTPSPTLPTEGDLAGEFIRALSVRADGPPTRGPDGVWAPNHRWEPGALGEAAALAATRIGWRAAAAVAITACNATRPWAAPAADELAAILGALTAPPQHGS
jgi:hypothetical protein